MSDISYDIINLRRMLNQLEILNANPDINGKKLITDQVQDIKLAILQLEILVADYAN